MDAIEKCGGERIFHIFLKHTILEETSMKKVFAVVLAMIMVLAMGVTSFAASITTVWGGDTETEPLDFTWFDQVWDVNNENVLFTPYDCGDIAMLISGTEAFENLFNDDVPSLNTLSSIKVESQKGIADVKAYKLADYVKSLAYGTSGIEEDEVVGIKTKSSWPFDDFDLEDLVPTVDEDEDEIPDYFDPEAFTWDGGEATLDLFFIYIKIPTYAGAKVSTDNYFTLKFRENTTGADYVQTSEKFWICVYPFAVDEEDVDTYADEDEAMELVWGHSMLTEDLWDDLLDDIYEDVPDGCIWYFDSEDTDETPYVIEKESWKEIVGSTLIVGVDDDLEVEIGKIVKGQSGINFYFETDVDDDVQAIDEDAELAALLFFDTTNVLDSDFVISYTFEIEDAAKAGDYFLYELVGDELTLVEKIAVGKGDDEVDVEIKRKAGDTLGQYYLSDVELVTETVPADNEENPNTGASEVAGVAVALAVISLVSAAAVALKK